MKHRMQNKLRTFTYGIIFLLLTFSVGTGEIHAASSIKVIKLQATNPQSVSRANIPFVITTATISKIAPDFEGKAFLVTTSDQADLSGDAAAIKFRAIRAQADDLDGDGKADEIAFQLDLTAREKKIVTLVYGTEDVISPLKVKFAPRTHAAFSQKYEGMGWESDRTAWRLYFDKRNAIDLYGKRQSALTLDYYAMPKTDYHEESPFGRDIYKNGDALGIGSIGALIDGKAIKVSDVAERSWKILAAGGVRSILELTYKGWKIGNKTVDLTSRITIWAGQHYFEHAVTVSNGDGIQLVTGLPLKQDVEAIRLSSSANGKARSYLATWGRQVIKTGATATESLPDQNLGLGILVPNVAPKDAASPSDSANHLIKIPLEKNTATYFVVAGWDQEAEESASVFGLEPSLTIPAAVKSLESWERYVESLSQFVSSPAPVNVVSKSPAIVAGPPDSLGEIKSKTYAQAVELMRQDVDKTAVKWSKILDDYRQTAKIPANDRDLNFDGTPNKWTTRRGKGFFTERDNVTGEWEEQNGFYWTGNFWVGELWRLYEKTKDEKYAKWARKWNDVMLGQEPNVNHDVGFLYFYTSAFGADLTKEKKYRESALRAAERLKKLYNPKTNLIAAWGIGGEDTIIDTMMNLQILYWASKETGDKQWLEVGRNHALKSAEWLIRPDGSVIQSVHYDPTTGKYRFGHTHQGYGNDTAWARGTGWALYGFAIAARETNDPKLLAAAEKVARFVIRRTPDDFVAWHDYHDEGVHFRLKDTSAAALTANGFFQLSELVKDKKQAAEYRAFGEKIIGALIDRYLTPVGDNDKTPVGVLRHGSVMRPNDTGLSYGDYYLLDALLWLDKRGIKRN